MKKSLLLASALLFGTTFAQAEEMRIYLHGAPQTLPENSTIIPVGNNDDPTRSHFYIWSSTFTPSAATDNEVGAYELWTISSPQAWWGAGYNVPAKEIVGQEGVYALGCDFSQVDFGWMLHFKVKTNITASELYVALLPDVTGDKISFNSDGTGDYLLTVDGGEMKYDGTWCEFDLPIEMFLDNFASDDEIIEQVFAMHYNANWLTFGGGDAKGKTVAFTDMYLHGEPANREVEPEPETPEVVVPVTDPTINRIYLHGAPATLPDKAMAVPVGDENDKTLSQFYIWDNTFTTQDATDEEVGAHSEWIVANKGWWGVGYNAPLRVPVGASKYAEGCDLSVLDASWMLHFKLKTNIQGSNIELALCPDVTGDKIVFNSNTTNAIKTIDGGDMKFDGTWCEFDIPVTEFTDLMVSDLAVEKEFFIRHYNLNWLVVNGGGKEGEMVALHDVYLHGDPVDRTNEKEDGLDMTGITRIYLYDAPVSLPAGSMAVNIGDPDNVETNHIYIWEGTLNDSWTVTNNSWWGIGFNAPRKVPTAAVTEVTQGVDFSVVDFDWNLHFKMKTDITDSPITMGFLPDVTGDNVVFNSAGGDGVYTQTIDGGTIKYDGTWNEIEIPISTLVDNMQSNLAVREDVFTRHHDANWLTLIGGGNAAGKSFALADMYLYDTDPTNSAINDVYVDECSIVVLGNTVISESAEIYNLQGIKVMDVNGEASIESLAKGVYIVRAADGDTVKIAR